MSSFVYPRLDPAAARALLIERAPLESSQLFALSELKHNRASPSATGGQVVPERKLASVRDAIREAAENAGYPRPLARGQAQTFDRPCGSELLRIMNIVPADAASVGVWSFLTLVVVPEIGSWRFPGAPESRMLGKPRNVLRRLWWRAWALGPDLDAAPDGCAPLGEDEFVQIMERTTLGGNIRTARAIQNALWRAELNGLDVARSELMRQLARRVRGQRSHLALDVLDGAELDLLLDHLVATGVAALRGG
ncbi:hypothetical protein [Williamsia serinedens]|uniref:Uncharacterized protein n=1 Tax=Williamsia serinedens TaxID=391736 RepID=A0ABT1H0M8_9NOCA|nr:hypothetical protein [Williamsia serinedens]MCP2160798.1 hypothetical protein [Williamsia serinedens]